MLRDDAGTAVKEAPGMADIVGLGPETSLDFNGNPRRPGCTFEQDFDRLGAGQPDVAYAHVATDPSAPGRLALQYWFFWYFDDYVNTHEGDWEFIQLVWDVPTADEALRTAPVETGYSQHSGGECADWDGGKLERRGDHPVVYAAAGSHANFYTPDLFLGRSADQGFGCDDARPPGTSLQTQARLLPSGEVDPEGPDAWLLFQGRWGEFQKPPYDAPPGPRTKEEWSGPIAWQESLRDGSFAVPSGTSVGPTATGAFCAVVDVGGKIYTAVTVAPRAGADRPGPGDDGDGRRPQHRLVAARAAPAPAHARRGADAERGARRLPRATTGAAAHRAPLPARGDPGGGAAAGGVRAHAPGRPRRPSRGAAAWSPSRSPCSSPGRATCWRPPSWWAAWRSCWTRPSAARGHDIRRGLPADPPGRAPPAAHRDPRGRHRSAAGASPSSGSPGPSRTSAAGPSRSRSRPSRARCPREAMERSRALVRGRWWRTASIATTVNVVAAVSGPIVGIAFMFLTPLPLATINAVSSAVFVFVMPLAGAALAFLYGDLVGPPPGRQSPVSSSVTPIRSSSRRTSGDRLRTRIGRPDDTAASWSRSSARTPEESMNATSPMSISMAPEVVAASAVTRRTSDSPPAMSSSPFRA